MNVTKTYWEIAVDKRTGSSITRLNEIKSDQIEPMCLQIQKRKEDIITVKYSRCDNSGENKSLEELEDKSYW